VKKILVLLIAIFALTITTVHTASAHELESDTTVGAVLHIQPDDNPMVNTQITYVLAFTDTANKLDLKACDCTVAIQRDGTTIQTQPLDASAKLTSTNTYTFTEPGAYTIRVTGEPKTHDAFSEFNLSYPIRVTEPKSITTQAFPIALAVGFVLLIIILLLVAVRADRMLS